MLTSVFQALVLPSGLIIVLFVAGLAGLAVPRLRRAARLSLVLAALVYAIFGAGPVAFTLLGSLEYRYPGPDAATRTDSGIRDILVLAGYGERDPDVSPGSELNAASLYRVTEALILVRQAPGRRVIVSGSGQVPVLMRDLFVRLGLEKTNIELDHAARGTCDSAFNQRGRLEGSRFFLVTSAGHMPRALRCFRPVLPGAIPVPTQYLTRRNPLATAYLPSPAHLLLSDLAVAEYAGMLRDWLPTVVDP